MKRLALIAALGVVAAGCGGSSASLYTRAATSACLLNQPNVRTGPVPASDFVGNSATGGGFEALLPGNQVTITFGLTAVDASNIDDAYRRFRARNVGIDDVLRTQQNAVMLWHAHPSDSDLSLVTGCLKS